MPSTGWIVRSASSLSRPKVSGWEAGGSPRLGEVDAAIDAYQRALAIDDRDMWAMEQPSLHLHPAGPGRIRPFRRWPAPWGSRRNVPVFQNNFPPASSGRVTSRAKEAYGEALEADSTYSKAAVGLERVKVHGMRRTARRWTSRPCRKSSQRKWTVGRIPHRDPDSTQSVDTVAVS